MEARTISTLANGRFIMGLGAAKAAALHMGWTQETMRPVPVHRESIGLVRKLLSGEAVDHQGKFYKLEAPRDR